jgi:hypothetical protein
MGFIERKIVEIDWSQEDEGLTVQGRLLKIESVRYRDGIGLVYTVRGTKSAEVIRFKGSSRLNLFLSPADIGKDIAVRYDGEDKSKSVQAGWNYPKAFTVMVDDATPETNTNQHNVAVSDDDIPS